MPPVEKNKHAHSGEVPKDVKDFIFDLHDATRRGCILEDVQKLYEIRYKEITDQFYGNSYWPDVNAIAKEGSNDELFLTLYRYFFSSRCSIFNFSADCL
jgi:hypothetical protein